MEMGKLTAKLRDAVPVCFLVEGKEIKRYKNIDIPDELKKLEYQDFKFDVPSTGTITFKISFAAGVLPEKLPKERERLIRTSKDAPVVVVGETPATAPSKEAETIEAAGIEASNEDVALIIFEEAPAVEILENATYQEASDEVASPMEVQTAEEATPEANVAIPAKKTAAKPKKAPAIMKDSKE